MGNMIDVTVGRMIDTMTLSPRYDYDARREPINGILTVYLPNPTRVNDVDNSENGEMHSTDTITDTTTATCTPHNSHNMQDAQKPPHNNKEQKITEAARAIWKLRSGVLASISQSDNNTSRAGICQASTALLLEFATSTRRRSTSVRETFDYLSQARPVHYIMVSPECYKYGHDA